MKKTILFAAALALAVVPYASAQTITPATVDFSWGALHLSSGQAVVVNFLLNDHGPALALPVEFELDDKNGNTLFRQTVMVPAGRVVSLAIALGDKNTAALLPAVIPSDLYAIIDPNERKTIDPNIHTVTPCVKVALPAGPIQPVLDRLTPTLEVMDISTGRGVSFANNPHAIIAVLIG